jgi:hypothetical protein
MLYGSDMSLHKKEFLLNLGKYWLQGLREYDLDIVLGYDYHSPEPLWWRRLFPDRKFLDCLTDEEKLEVSQLAGTPPLNPIQELVNNDIIKYLKELNTNARIREGLSGTTQQV